MVVLILLSGERALEQLNYSLIKNRAWYVIAYSHNVRVTELSLQPYNVVPA